MIDEKSFIKIFRSSFWKKIGESLVPMEPCLDKYAFLKNLHQEIIERTYNPSAPRDFIITNKHNHCPRFVPTFTRKDYCVYFFAVKMLEKELAQDRIPGTFGGFSLGNQIKIKEDEERLELEYIPFNSFNEFGWKKAWGDFQKLAKVYSDDRKFDYYIKFDIGSFYDTINLSLLEKNIRHAVGKNKQEIVTLLFHFLQNWNRKLEGYNLKTVGIPQDEIGDCSRILANFYLQEYDKIIFNICDKLEAKYLRYADDQIVFAKDKDTARKILFEASKELFKLNLHVNTSKIIEFESNQDFSNYWAFDIFSLLEDEQDRIKINLAVDLFIRRKNQKKIFKYSSVLKRLLRIDFNLIDPSSRHLLLSMYFEEDFLAEIRASQLKHVKTKVNNDKEFFDKLNSLIPKIKFNSFHYNLYKFYKKANSQFEFEILLNRINEMKLNFNTSYVIDEISVVIDEILSPQ
jgi:hypothetical protein